MIKVFGQTDTSFLSNGDIVLNPLTAKIRKEDNGAFYLDLVTDLSYIDFLTEGRIIVANTPQGDQAFRINNVTKTKSKLTTKANHVYFDSRNYLISDSYVVDKTCNDALDHLNSATDITSPFTTLSNIGTVNSYRCVRKSLQEAIAEVLDRWGGHLVRDNFSISILDTIGQDNGVTVRYRKNLKEITCEENWDAVCTKVLPVGKDGLLLNAVDPSASIYVESETQYALPYTKTVSFNQDGVIAEDYSTEADYMTALVNDLRDQAINYLDVYSVPQVNYTLKANLEKITDIGDSVEVIDERLGIDIMTNVIAYVYDCILETYIEVEFGNFRQTLSNLIPSLTAQTEKLVEEQTETVKIILSDELRQATDAIWGALGNSYVIYEGDRILVVDTLPKEDATNVMMISSGGIGFSTTGIYGTFNSAWTIDGTLNMQAINVINLVADLIKGGTLKLGSESNVSGILELYDEENNLIGLMNKDGLKMYGTDGSYVLMNNDVGFAGYDRNNNKIYWVDADEFHMKKGVMEEEITLCGVLRFIRITIMNGNTVVNDGIGLISIATD